LGNVVAWNRHDRAQINKIGELFGIEDFIRHVEGELREKEEAKLKNNAASQFQFYDSSDVCHITTQHNYYLFEYFILLLPS
jgi:hypothetical protein